MLIRQRTNPWLSFSDLFAALLVATFAGFMMLSASYQSELERFQKTEGATTKMRQEADRIISGIQQTLAKNIGLASRVRRCGEDTCIDLDIHFSEGHDTIEGAQEKDALDQICSTIKTAVDGLQPWERKDIELVIEGHTNKNQPQERLNPRDKYLFNWNLSGRRAASVLYVFNECGFTPPTYNVQAIGYADSKPACVEDSRKCNEQNRRTTLLLRADTRSIEARVGK